LVQKMEETLRKTSMLQELFTQDFPSCRDDIHDFFRCIKTSQMMTGSENLHFESCVREHIRFTWCLLSTFCPAEAQDLRQCMKGRIPDIGGLNGRSGITAKRGDEYSIPFLCTWKFRRFDRCLQRKTDEFAQQQQQNGTQE